MSTKKWMVIALVILIVVQLACATITPDTQQPGEEVVAPTEVLAPTAPANVPTAAPVQEGVVSSLKAAQLVEIMDRFVLRPDDLPFSYRIPPGGEQRLSNLGVIQALGEVAGKRYIIDTGRLDGWMLQLERRNKQDVAPYVYESSIEVFDSPEGAELALSPAWFKAYTDEDYEFKWVEEGCYLGDECIFYYAESLDPATNLTTLRYHVAFRYQNALVWVMGRGLDIDVAPRSVLVAAESVYNKLEQAYLAAR